MVTALASSAAVAQIDGSSNLIKTYTSGVITSPSCGSLQNMNVAVVGYNQTSDKPYYVV
jgi:hypothetical protein